MAKVTKTQVVKFIRKGEKGDKGDPTVNIIISGENVVFTKQSQGAIVTVEVYIGEQQLTYGNGQENTFVCGVLGGTYLFDGKVYWGFRVDNDNKTFKYLLNLREKADLSEMVSFTVIVNGVTYNKSITFKTIYDGATLRGPQEWSDCAIGYAFQSGKAGDEWKDAVIYNDNYYSCIKSHTKTASNYPGSTTDQNNGYWQLGDKIELVATKILLATYALVKNLGVEVIDMRDASGNILFQAKDGNVTCKTGTFENVNISGKLKGSVRNPFVSAGDSFDTDYSDNVVMISSGGGWINAYSLPWDAGQSGRRITLVNYKWGSTVSEGQAGINAPSGKYFYMNGLQKSTLNISREAVELLGYGTTSTFYGWIVLRRTDLVTTYRYGRELKVLAFGTVTGSKSSASISYKTFDGTTLSVSRLGEGIYKITMPSGWFAEASHCRVILTGVGQSLGSSTAAIKATLYSRSTTEIVVHTSDDSSNNDGTFDFMITNGNDWTV